jgi:hypothetical protein
MMALKDTLNYSKQLIPLIFVFPLVVRVHSSYNIWRLSFYIKSLNEFL